MQAKTQAKHVYIESRARPLKSYTLELVRLLSVLSESSVASALMKHVHVMLPFFSALPKSRKQLTRLLVERWSADEDEGVRILAFLCLIRLTRLDQASMYESTAKAMYLAYVKNCKFTSPGTWPLINFMRRSLAELFALDQKSAYNHAFVYVRQLSIGEYSCHACCQLPYLLPVANLVARSVTIQPPYLPQACGTRSPCRRRSRSSLCTTGSSSTHSTSGCSSSAPRTPARTFKTWSTLWRR